MPTRYEFIPFQGHHIEEVLEIERLSNPAPWSRASFETELQNPQAHYWVVVFKGKVVGFAGYWDVVDEAHITNIAVHPQHRRKGLGERLMSTLLIDAKSRGMRCATLEVRRNNQPAIALYEKFGFVVCAIRKNYYVQDQQDALVMWLYGLQERDFLLQAEPLSLQERHNV
ncbi:MAG: ribosomal protein S18-alanine N-acetyltransferase [Candidatus Caldarchaeum sp.]